MKIYLAGTQGDKANLTSTNKDLYLLESFYYLKDKHMDLYKNHNFLLDSGAFTFFSGKKIDWDNYVTRYINFINKHGIDLFFELDIDKIIGIDKVEKIRKRIEEETEKQSIPVWRPSRGIKYWYNMIKEYSYVAISASGKYDSAWTRKKDNIPVLKKMLKLAKENNCKVHGLGFTSLKLLSIISFYSVDSTSWIAGQQYCTFYKFNGKGMNQINKTDNNKRGINPKGRLLYNFNEWVKFQKYAYTNL
tara:strand:- start:761 stop:1501 length:741 start_codon:yes stop_codon:yes gene_type:complete